MRRADRLFRIIQILRGARQPLTARALAEELETSVRSVYRDIAELQAQRVPIRGEAGVGYVLDRGYELPPLMLTADELEAAVLGAQWVATRGDPTLARAARDLVAKLSEVVPPSLRDVLRETGLFAVPSAPGAVDALPMDALRAAIREGRQVQLDYADVHGAVTQRTVWPVALVYFEDIRMLAAWCELRGEFRHFRTDRVRGAAFPAVRYPDDPRRLRRAWVDDDLERRRQRCAAGARAPAVGVSESSGVGASDGSGVGSSGAVSADGDVGEVRELA